MRRPVGRSDFQLFSEKIGIFQTLQSYLPDSDHVSSIVATGYTSDTWSDLQLCDRDLLVYNFEIEAFAGISMQQYATSLITASSSVLQSYRSISCHSRPHCVFTRRNQWTSESPADMRGRFTMHVRAGLIEMYPSCK